MARDRMATHSRNTLNRRPVTAVHGQGVYFEDEVGRRYLDLASQTLNLLLGQRHPVVLGAVTGCLESATFFDQDFASPLHDAARDRLASLLPSHLEVLNLRMNDGSSALECAVKQARRTTGRSRVLTVNGIYLGQNNLCIHLRGLGKRPADLLNGGTEDVVFAPMA
jgi:taurine---2-oxoglutarate transaminase